jgi:hypothetical protein
MKFCQLYTSESVMQLIGDEWRSRDSSVGIAIGYGLDDREVGVRVPVGSRNFSSPRPPDRLYGPPSFLSNVYRELVPYPVVKAAGA